MRENGRQRVCVAGLMETRARNVDDVVQVRIGQQLMVIVTISICSHIITLYWLHVKKMYLVIRFINYSMFLLTGCSIWQFDKEYG